ncbi:MAG: hypothetical protein AB1510_04150 [Bacillota bacterium]
MTSLLHQLGHRYQWSLLSILEENSGDGVIVGPRYMGPETVSQIPHTLRARSLFDPQFFLPNTARGKLQDYSFFPDVLSGGYSTTDWNTGIALDCASRCLEFQRAFGFSALVIPTRFYEGMPSEFIPNQENQFVIPFLQSIEGSRINLPVYLQLILTDQMLRDETYRTGILNWATSFPELDGIYLIYHVHNRQKQIGNIDFLMGLMNFIAALKNANMAVFVGYTNTESILLLCAGPDAVTMGSYENLRMFGLRSFEKENGSVTRGPNARVYIPRLMDWVDYQYIGAIGRVVGNIDEYIDDDNYRIRMFEPFYNWHFTKPEPYKHYFKSFTQQFQRIASSSDRELLENVAYECQQALEEFRVLRSSGIVFPPGNGGEHLASWMTVINLWRGDAYR